MLSKHAIRTAMYEAVLSLKVTILVILFHCISI